MAKKTKPKGVGLIRLQVKNLGITKDVAVDLIKGVNIFQGDNGAGKSTILNAIKYALEGKRAVPADVIRHGFDKDGKAHRAEIVLETTSFDVKLEVYKDKKGEEKHRLAIRNKEGFVRDAPQEFLNAISKEWNDPKVLAEMTAEQLYSILMDYCKVDLTEFDTKIEELKTEQSYVRKRKKEIGIVDPVAECKVIDVTEAIAELKKLEQFNREQEEQKRKIQAFEDRLGVREQELQVAEDEVDRLKAKLVEAEAFVVQKKDVIKKAKEIIKNEPKPKKLKDTTDLTDQIKNAEKNRKQMEQYQRYKQWMAKTKEFDKLFDANKTRISKLETDKDNAVKTAKMPVKGLDLTEDLKVTYKGDLWDNCSESDRLTIGAEIIINTTPEKAIRYMVIHQGESILSARRKKLHDQLLKSDYTCLMQVASENPPEKGEGVFYIEEGEIKE